MSDLFSQWARSLGGLWRCQEGIEPPIHGHVKKEHYLVGGRPTPLKNMSQLGLFHILWKIKKCSKTTNQLW